MLRRNIVRGLAAGLAFLASAGAQRAAGQSLGLSSALVNFPAAGVAQLNAGEVEGAGMTVSIDPGGSSTGWTLYLRSTRATLSVDGKPVSDLRWRLQGSSTWSPLGTVDEPIARGIGPATVTVVLHARLRWAADGPGDYATEVMYTLATN